ncbi:MULTISPECIES: BNR-4 repeat-containing protein [Pseudoalteromonas]|uniref:BNR-4 repeat-containing protein n=1 Tax=Pseudoalteromonas TaxID=53246 RepID=UPI0013EED5E0|nr:MULTISPECIES: BNR-4 repeat-containing protein [Pseudoalteromonas]MCG7540704.1 BNR repeat-containing protein [Pseudoalteromonas sp. OF7H-1]MCG9769818.1 BNR repeat-containing protein [Pseudoalteromonas piscicida]QUI61369.1 hypothetical protein GSF04_02225 [Pseudoalteromonas sp. A22]QZO14872.1 BNR repeat-containing protein [Pseudoalteromonas piscicida]USE71152.1 hypothetical protein CTT31_18810 [Pseudoalteromonas flavipulchra]
MNTNVKKALLAGILLSPAFSSFAVDSSKGYSDLYNFNKHGKCRYEQVNLNYQDDSHSNYANNFRDELSQYNYLNLAGGLNRKLLRGSWYSLDNQLFLVGGVNVSKYSGPSSTGSAKAAPMAIQRGDWTYYVINGAHSDCAVANMPPNKNYERLVIAVGAYNYKTGEIKEPVIVHVKETSDFHDTGVINMDDKGYVYVFISGRNSNRGGLIYRSTLKTDLLRDGNVGAFELVHAENELGSALDREHNCPDSNASCHYLGFTYPQAWWVEDKFVLLNTRYIQTTTAMRDKFRQDARRQLYFTEVAPTNASTQQVAVKPSKKLVALDDKLSFGHYAVSTEKDGVIAVAFNVHVPDRCTINGFSTADCYARGKDGGGQLRHYPNDNRTNLYFMYSSDNGRTWYNRNGQRLIDTFYNEYINSFNKLNQALLYQPDNNVDLVDGYNPYTTTIVKRIYVKDLDITVNDRKQVTSLKVLVNETDGIHGFVPKTASESRKMIRTLVIDQQGNKSYVGCYNASDCWADHAYSSGAIRTENNSGYSEIAFPMSSGDSLAGGKVHLYNSNLKSTQGIQAWSYLGAQHYTDPKEANYIRKIHDAKSITGAEPVYFWAQSGTDKLVDLVLSGKNGRQVQLNGNFGSKKKLSCPTQYVFRNCN